MVGSTWNDCIVSSTDRIYEYYTRKLGSNKTKKITSQQKKTKPKKIVDLKQSTFIFQLGKLSFRKNCKPSCITLV